MDVTNPEVFWFTLLFLATNNDQENMTFSFKNTTLLMLDVRTRNILAVTISEVRDMNDLVL